MKKTFTLCLLVLSSIFLLIACNETPNQKSKPAAKTTPLRVITDTSTFTLEGIDYLPYKYTVRTEIPPKPRTKDITGGEAIANAKA
ncbi:MAG: hypothetical protein AB8B69_18630, partial [Chitinophagales bacterium]